MAFCSLADEAFIWSLKDWVETPGAAGDTNTAVKLWQGESCYFSSLCAFKFTFHNRCWFGPSSRITVSTESLLAYREKCINWDKSTINISILNHKWGYCTRALLSSCASRLAKCFAFFQQLNKSFKSRKDFLLSHGYYFQRVSDTPGLQHTEILKPESARHQRLEGKKRVNSVGCHGKVWSKVS